MRIEVNLIDNATINLEGAIDAELASISPNTGGRVSKPGYSVNELKEAGQSAFKAYKSVGEFANEQKKVLDVSNDVTKSIVAKTNDLNQFQRLLKGSGFLRAGLQAAPFVAGALDLVNFFIGGGKSSSSPQLVQMTPMSLTGSINMKGSITTEYRYKHIEFYTPGSKNAHTRDICSLDLLFAT